MTMTRDELIRRIEAGETGAEVLCAIAREAQWRFDEKDECHVRTSEALDVADRFKGWAEAVEMLDIPNWLSSLDAAVTLVGDGRWFVDNEGWAAVDLRGKGFACHVSRNPAAALVAAWLKATADE